MGPASNVHTCIRVSHLRIAYDMRDVVFYAVACDTCVACRTLYLVGTDRGTAKPLRPKAIRQLVGGKATV